MLSWRQSRHRLRLGKNIVPFSVQSRAKSPVPRLVLR
jgi:hypothetical protein